VAHIPLMIIPFILYNIGIAGLFGASGSDPWAAGLWSVTMISGGAWSLTLGDGLRCWALSSCSSKS
jgi:hypothetical protein